MSTPAAGVDGGQQGQQGNEGTDQAGPDFSPVMDRIDQIEATIGPVAEWVQSQQAPPEAQGEDYADFVNRLFAGEEAPAETEQEQQAQLPQVFTDPQAFQQLLDRAVQEKLDKTVGPELEAGRQDRQQREINELMTKYPALKEQDVAGPVVQAAQQFAYELAQRLGQPELADTLWRQPGVVEQMYLAEQARQTSGAEVPAGANGGEARLEGANGANPGADQPNLAEQIIQARQGSQGDFQWF